MKNMLFLILLLVLLVSGCSKQQKVIYEAQSISYKNNNRFMSSQIQIECNSISESLSSHLNNGWKVVTSSPKEKIVAYDMGTCIGTEYILEKNVPPAIFAKLFSKTDSNKSNTTTTDSKTETSTNDMKARGVPANNGMVGIVVEAMNSGGYTYVEVTDEKGVKFWLAFPEVKVAKGDKIEYPETRPLKNFTSKTLNKTFEKITFVPGIRIVK